MPRMSFRPLDGESFSKRLLSVEERRNLIQSFRPLDGESFSKPYPCKACKLQGLRGGFRAKNLTSTFWCQNLVQISFNPLKSTILSHRGKTQIASFTFESITQKNCFCKHFIHLYLPIP